MPGQLPNNMIMILADQMETCQFHWKHIYAFYIALLLCPTENKFNSARPMHDTLPYCFTCLKFEPPCLLCKNLFLIAKVAENFLSSFVCKAAYQGKRTGVAWW